MTLTFTKIERRRQLCCLMFMGLFGAVTATPIAAGGEPDKSFQLPVQKFEPLPGKAGVCSPATAKLCLPMKAARGHECGYFWHRGRQPALDLLWPSEEADDCRHVVRRRSRWQDKATFQSAQFRHAENLKAAGITERFAW